MWCVYGEREEKNETKKKRWTSSDINITSSSESKLSYSTSILDVWNGRTQPRTELKRTFICKRRIVKVTTKRIRIQFGIVTIYT